MGAAWQYYDAWKKMCFVEIGKQNSEFRDLKFPELENCELEVPGAWELRNLGTCFRVGSTANFQE